MKLRSWFLIGLIGLFLVGCGSSVVRYSYPVKDNRRKMWTEDNSKVRKFKRIYRSSRHIKVGLKKAAKYLPTIQRIFKKHKLPPQLAYLPLLESGFRAKAKSKTGALGMWQFMKPTAREYGLRVNWLRDDRLNWKKSSESAARYLAYLGKRFNYNWELALAAYNGGPGYISRAMKQQGTWNYWELELKQETEEYVPKFIAMLQIAQEQFPNTVRADFSYQVASR